MGNEIMSSRLEPGHSETFYYKSFYVSPTNISSFFRRNRLSMVTQRVNFARGESICKGGGGQSMVTQHVNDTRGKTLSMTGLELHQFYSKEQAWSCVSIACWTVVRVFN